MPIAYIDVPPGIRVDAKKKLVREVFVALDEAYRVPDTRIFLREGPLEQVSQDGRLDSAPAKPVAFLEVPPGIRLDVKRQVLKRVSAAIANAYRLPDILIFMRESHAFARAGINHAVRRAGCHIPAAAPRSDNAAETSIAGANPTLNA